MLTNKSNTFNSSRREFIKQISFRDNKPLKVKGEEGLKDVKIINAIEESIKIK